MNLFSNKKKDKFLESVPTESVVASTSTHAARSKFNFSYFSEHPAGQALEDLSADNLRQLYAKLQHFSKEPLSYWKTMKVGKSGRMLSIYGGFPSKSDFSHPPHVPHEAEWGRFRLDFSFRLVGFVVPDHLDGRTQNSTGALFDSNTFYVVFFDRDHRFYKGSDEAK